MRKRNFILSLVITGVFIALQSTILQKIAVRGVIPDVALVVIVFSSNSMGAMRGQFLGFIAGLLQDFLSSGPLGFNALIKTIIGFIFGKLKGKLFLDSILLPVIFILSATILKEGFTALTGLIFLGSEKFMYFGRSFLIELGLNAFLSPFIFALMKLLKLYRVNEKDGF